MMTSNLLNSTERRAVISLSLIMALRLIGLFMVIPIFSIYAKQLPGATPLLIGIAIGAYGLTQALLQIPFGALSDRYGRKPVIAFGLLLFILGSLIAANAHTMMTMIVGRSLQGAGAVGSVLLATIADFTRPEQRSKAMAIAGMSIGASFFLAMLLGPLLTHWMDINKIFYLALMFGVIAIALLYAIVPSTPKASIIPASDSTQPLFSGPLIQLYHGIFLLHLIFTASFIVIPICLLQRTHLSSHDQWKLFLPALIIAFVISLLCISTAEREKKTKFYFLLAIATLIAGMGFLWVMTNRLQALLGIALFFTGFSILEAFLPSLISRLAPPQRKGAALGIFSCAQFLGIFVGGLVGGWLYGKYSFPGVYFFCMMLLLIWFFLSARMASPHTASALVPQNELS